MLVLWLTWAVALAQDAASASPTPDEVTAAFGVILQWGMGIGGAGGIGASGASLYLRSQIKAQEERLAVAEAALVAVSARLSVLETEPAEDKPVAGANARIAALAERVKSAETAVSRLDGRADDANSKRAEHNALLARLREDLDGLRTDNRTDHKDIRTELARRLDRLADSIDPARRG